MQRGHGFAVVEVDAEDERSVLRAGDRARTSDVQLGKRVSPYADQRPLS
jgi:hypothetical protein